MRRKNSGKRLRISQKGGMKLTYRFTLHLAEVTREAVERFAEHEGCSFNDACRRLINRGLDDARVERKDLKKLKQ